MSGDEEATEGPATAEGDAEVVGGLEGVAVHHQLEGRGGAGGLGREPVSRLQPVPAGGDRGARAEPLGRPRQPQQQPAPG